MKAEEAKDKLEAVSFTISRVPRRTFIIFKKLAQEEFCSDYGMTLKFLLDKALDDTDEKIAHLQRQIDELRAKIDNPKPKVVTFGKREG